MCVRSQCAQHSCISNSLFQGNAHPAHLLFDDFIIGQCIKRCCSRVKARGGNERCRGKHFCGTHWKGLHIYEGGYMHICSNTSTHISKNKAVWQRCRRTDREMSPNYLSKPTIIRSTLCLHAHTRLHKVYQCVRTQKHKEPPLKLSKPLSFHYISPEWSLVGHT